MFSRLVDLNHLEPKELPKQRKELKCGKIFDEEKPAKKFPEPLEENSLLALKNLLSKHKEETEIDTSMPDEIEGMNLFAAPPILGHTEGLATASILAIEPSSAVSVLYSKMVETLVHVDHNGIKETTIFLDNDAFASSKLFGSKVVITEFSTAPKVFNIHIVGTPEAIAFLEPHAGALLNALQNHSSKFQVHRLDLTLLNKKDKYSIPKVEQRFEKEGKM